MTNHDWRLANLTEDYYRETLHDWLNDCDPVARRWNLRETPYRVEDDPDYDHLPMPPRHDMEADDKRVRIGKCPRCHVSLEEGQCYVCGKVWRAATAPADRPWYHGAPSVALDLWAKAEEAKKKPVDEPAADQLALGDAA